MSIFLQIMLGLAPAAILFLILTIVQKKHRPRNISMLSLFVLFLAGSLVGSIVYKPESPTAISKNDAATCLDLVYAVAEKDSQMQLAEKMLRNLRINAVPSSDILECDALLRARNGDYLAPKALMAKATQLYNIEYADEFLALCDACIAESKTDTALKVFYGEGVAKADAIEKLIAFANKKLQEKLKNADDSVNEAADILIESEIIFSGYLNSNALDKETVFSLVKRIQAAIKDNPTLLSNSQVRLCRLKLMVLNGDYEDIAAMIDEDSSYEELAIVSELYISGLVDESDFSTDFAKNQVKIYKAVSKQLKKAIKKIPKEHATEIRRSTELLNSLEKAHLAPALYKVKDQISKFAANEDFTDRPKAYLQLARVEHALGEDERSQQYITDSLDSIGICEDDNFTIPMTHIVDTITDKDDPEKLKNVAQYVDDVTSNTADQVVGKAVNEAKEQLENSDRYDDYDDDYYDDYYDDYDDYYDDYDDDEDDEDDEDEDEDKLVLDTNFDSFMTDYISQKRVSFNITNIDASQFETVKATVSVDDSVSITAEELKNMIILEDCGVQITDFQIEKIEYKRANILLCCDTSGSMSGQPIYDLRNAVSLFADTASDIERLALVSFDDTIREIWDFGTSNEEISAAGASLNDGGGTNMYDALIGSVQKFSLSDDEVNFILLLSDGDDNTKRTAEEIRENIGIPAQNRKVVLFSLGLGDSVNTEYMNTLASSTGGSFLYINDSTSLNSFYDYLRGQILNQYIITFKAENTLSVDRELEIRLKDDALSGDVKYYNLRGDGTDAEYAPSELIGLEEKGVYGLDTRLIYTSSKPVSVKLSGFGFQSTDSFSVTLDGDLDYGSGSVTVAYENENTLSLLIPGGIACGTYDLRVSVNGKTAILKEELSVVAQGQEKTTKFGPYVFTSYQKVEDGNTITLSRYVTMNGWLNFDGDVTLTGDLHGYSITMTENSGSYVKYYSDTATGLAGYMAKRNSSLSLPAFGTFQLYNDTYNDPESEDYEVDTISTSYLSLGSMISLNAAGIELYPNRFEIRSDAFTTKFPLQETLMKAGDLDKLFNFSIAVDGVITNKTIGVRVDVDKTGDDDTEIPVNLGAMSIKMTPASYKIHIDTQANEYSVKFSTKLPFINAEGLGFSVEWKERDTDSSLQKLWPSQVMIMADIPINATLGTVPVTYRDFQLGVKDIDPNQNVLYWTFVGQMDVTSVTLSKYIPGLDKYFEDPAVVKLDDARLEFSLGQAYISLETKVQLLEAVTVAEGKIEAGRIPFTNVLLGINNEEATGLRIREKRGIMWQVENSCDIDFSGTREFSAHTRFIGAEVIGTCNLEVQWWIYEAAKQIEGRAIFGMYVDHNNVHNFLVKVRGQLDSKGTREYYIYWNKNEGFEYESKKF